MLYVIQTLAGNEHRVLERCRERVVKNGEEAFVPTYERKKKIKGEDTVIKSVLFPGYVFYRSQAPEDVFMRLKGVPYLTKLIGTDAVFIPVSDEEDGIITALGGISHNISVSIGVIDKGRLIILSGPLEGRADELLYYNRRKKIAGIGLPFLGEKRCVQVGLEIIGKK